MSSVAAQQQQQLVPLSSGAHSDTHTSLIPPASAGHSLANRQHASSHTINKTSLSSAMSPTRRTSSNRAPLQSRRDNVSDHTGSHSSNFRSTTRLGTSSPHVSPHKPASSAVSATAQRASGAELRSSFNRRQVTSRPNSTMEARVFDGVYDFGEFCDASSAAGNSGDYAGKKPCTGAKPQQLSPASLPSLSNYPTSTPMSEDSSLSKVPVTTTKPRTKASTAVSKRGRAPESKERAALLERVAQLCEDVATWDSRIARQRSLMREEARRSDDEAVFSSGYSPVDSTNVARRRGASSGGKRQPESAEQAPNPKADIKGGSRLANARLTKLRQENEQLEARYARQGAGAAEMSVQALVVRAEIQLQKVRLRLKEITATRRALEHRDKRAAHTIEEVHRRMPTADELKDRQLNEGIYSRKRLLCTAKELKENLERTRAAIKMMKVRCTDLEAHVRHKHLSAITPKEYEALCDTRDANAKAIEKHKSAISVYAIAFAHELRNTSKSSCGSDAGGFISQSGCSSITTSPCKRVVTPVRSGAMGKEQQQMIAEFEANKVNLLLQQKRSLLERKQALQTVVDELRKRVQKYNEEIKSNHMQAGLVYLDSNSTAGTNACAPLCSAQSREPSPPILTTTSETRTSYGSTPVAGSGAVAARKRSLRDVLRSPVIRRTEALTDWAEAKGRGGAATPRLGGGDAVGCKSRQENVGGNANLLNRDSVALPALVQTGKRASRAEHRASLSALAMLVDSPVKGATQMGSGVTAGGKTTASSHDTIEGEIDAHDSIESMLHKIDGANKRLGRAVFGQDSREGVSPPLLLQELHEADGVKVANNVLADSNVFEEKSMPAKVNGSSGGYTGGSGHRDHATSAAGCVHHADGKAMPDEWSAEEDEVEEELSVGRSDGSGRSTPEWLRND
ncbi:hypothetical protein, conserved [Leishmania tarentolae]|uniref:Uncharacterized protein n=1 Tax=Leishmania tarentolae TaxID=5689 RepID=A0A640KKN4_LEITA|nr:hypothetical protein, conserved [Leishmania tarentolae]